MKLTYEERLLVVEDHKRYGTAYTSRKWGLSERYVRTIVSKARNNSLSLNNKHTNYSAEFKIKVAKAAYNVKKDLPFHKNGIMHLFEGSCRFHQKDQICDAA